ncbi:MAG: hypothetical protein GWN30_11895, partial [Gammaproteobacteria bacterium]|nr:hypothetical protein [Gammaproteobacteria bacterium]
GSQTFVLAEGVWTDTRFDPENMQTTAVNFLSDDYFDLIRAYPQLGDAFALGGRVIAIYEGIAYEVVSTDVETDPLVIPETDADEVDVPEAVPDIAEDSHPAKDDQPVEEEPASSSPLCVGIIFPLLILPVGIITWYRRT